MNKSQLLRNIILPFTLLASANIYATEIKVKVEVLTQAGGVF